MSIRRFVKGSFLTTPYLILFSILIISILAPILEFKRLEISRNLYEILHNICHQVPTRCLWIFTSPMALCARCFTIYLALFITGIFLVKQKTNRIHLKVGVLLLIPCVIGGSTQYLGLRLSNNTLRCVTGTLAGIGIGLIFFPLYFRFVNFLMERR